MKSAVLALVSMIVVGHTVRGHLTNQVKLAESVCDFGQRLYQKLAVDKPNAVLSAISIHGLLTMISLGARNETATEMAQLLNLSSLPGVLFHDTYQEIIREVKSQDDIKSGIAKGILVNPNSTIEQEFKDLLLSKFSSEAFNFNLSAPGGAEKEINEYVARKTHGLVKDIVRNGSLSNDISLFPVAAFVFNGTWQDRFDKSKTQKQEFYHLDGTVVKIDMMRDSRSLLIKRDNLTGVDVVHVPFSGGRFGMYFAVPHRKDGIKDLESKLTTSGSVKDLFDNLSPSYVELVFPRFRIESHYHMVNVLKDMGFVNAATPGVADFTGISKEGNLHFSRVHHRAIIDIQESGAVTTQEGPQDNEPFPPVEVASDKIVLDRPFLFFFCDNMMGLVVAQGKFSC